MESTNDTPVPGPTKVTHLIAVTPKEDMRRYKREYNRLRYGTDPAFRERMLSTYRSKYKTDTVFRARGIKRAMMSNMKQKIPKIVQGDAASPPDDSL